MSTKVKGLLKGLRYISNVFDEEKEDEIQIGFPTDVKHVAHIGLDGPTANTPSWMQDFKSGSDQHPSGAAPSVEKKDDKSMADGSRNKDIPTRRSRHESIDSESSQPNSPTRRSTDGHKNGRRHRSSDPSAESGNSKPRRHHRHSKNEGEKNTSSAEAAPKSSRRRKTKTSSGDGSTKSTKSKAGSMTDISLPEIGSDL
ncbi:hypothetical protein L6164_025864 [Bauhinia variegata]|uniref:Uncharacterized protein n=1 Tax=Bauhinia variegata TaxID=167791 RepID=A0ACB9M200_BAUVA|nr:hypothetical protein L6164_025864 [Bauhinia variegata]